MRIARVVKLLTNSQTARAYLPDTPAASKYSAKLRHAENLVELHLGELIRYRVNILHDLDAVDPNEEDGLNINVNELPVAAARLAEAATKLWDALHMLEQLLDLADGYSLPDDDQDR